MKIQEQSVLIQNLLMVMKKNNSMKKKNFLTWKCVQCHEVLSCIAWLLQSQDYDGLRFLSVGC